MRFTYYIVYFFSKSFILLPYWALYGLSYIVYLLFYYLIPYRRKIIRQNLERSFPNKTSGEIKSIIKGFYRNLSDILVEGIKGFTIDEANLIKRYRFLNPEVLNELYDEGKDIIAVGGHYANWEWGIIGAPLQVKHKLIAFYTPLSNKHIDLYMRKSRMKWGTELVANNKVKSVFDAENDKPVCYFFGADQSPSNVRGAHWMEFLSQDTACIRGPEIFARRNRLPIVYFDVQRVKRGYYTVFLKVIEDDPVNTSSGEITENYMRTLEEIVIKKPKDFLWSHRRWKHQRV